MVFFLLTSSFSSFSSFSSSVLRTVSYPFIDFLEIESNENCLLWIEIPEIHLKQEVYSIGSISNQVDYHVEILEESNLEKRVLFLASHSGRGDNSYFNDLVYLEQGDAIWINYEGWKYIFLVEEVYYISKTGYFILEEEKMVDALYLITCSLTYPDKQLIVRAKLLC